MKSKTFAGNSLCRICLNNAAAREERRTKHRIILHAKQTTDVDCWWSETILSFIHSIGACAFIERCCSASYVEIKLLDISRTKHLINRHVRNDQIACDRPIRKWNIISGMKCEQFYEHIIYFEHSPLANTGSTTNKLITMIMDTRTSLKTNINNWYYSVVSVHTMNTCRPCERNARMEHVRISWRLVCVAWMLNVSLPSLTRRILFAHFYMFILIFAVCIVLHSIFCRFERSTFL